MGVIKFFSSSSFDRPKPNNEQPQPQFKGNPDPKNYKIMRMHEDLYGNLILMVNYPECTNYEGMKILVFKATFEEIEKQGVIDPHFSNNPNFISPIARFEPTELGWVHAQRFIESIS